ncbi:MAG: Nitrogen regulatory protein [Planctomycetota bacterium]|jgi:nitrogen regulatory protein P-II 2
MKLIVAIIRPERLEAVQAALNERDVYLMTVTEVRGCGRQKGYTEVYRGTEIQIKLLPKLKLEIAVNENFVEATIEAIVHSARTPETGQVGDGKIFVLSLEDCVRIRTGERGAIAIGP